MGSTSDSERRVIDSDSDSDEARKDPPMSEFHMVLLVSLRRVFGWPYKVFKVGDRVINDTKLSWNPDYWVEKDGQKILVIGTIDADTTMADFDGRMRSAFAVMSSNWFYQDKIALSARRSVLILPDSISKELSHERYLPYHYMFENVECQIIRQEDILELELFRDDEDRKRNPIRWAKPNSPETSRKQL